MKYLFFKKLNNVPCPFLIDMPVLLSYSPISHAQVHHLNLGYNPKSHHNMHRHHRHFSTQIAIAKKKTPIYSSIISLPIITNSLTFKRT